ncbi:bifunctional folylpolyglutamate synthase/dihydrofolate synthase [Devosia algicola]|uniref:Dihydrofolate synthase/folylpolyglutamate synthase n=1 Tax=Devosia algicola TaxID=3026418 RepID=A0ABY7YL38_9HYPH|nr:folylpolyglutamate synthase/dihydrofolate synthase family protein [Devosia algicola]WDR01966.1 bifunctional folylpolyglutamate synthase/dihydrofolate synthase [Devosia algicola]
MSRTDAILKRLLGLHPKLIDLHLERIERLLDRLDRPQDRLPPVIHVAGTNGKGSTIAYLRAFLEASGRSVHVYTSPHLVRFNERIRLAGRLVSTRRLNQALEHVERVNAGEPITYFEITTAAALFLFSQIKADYLLLEVGMGGRFDTTNVVARPLGTIILPVDLDHQHFLGNTIAKIAAEKAGILKRGAPAVIARQHDEGMAVIDNAARRLDVTPFVAGQDFDAFAQDGRLVYQDEAGLLDLPPPALIGAHQFDNAGVAIAAVRHFGLPVDEAAIASGLRKVVWPARLSPIKGPLRDLLGERAEPWLDGGHNAHGTRALSGALAAMNKARPAPLVLILGMMNTRSPTDVLAPFSGKIERILTLTIPGEQNAHSADHIAAEARKAGFDAKACRSIKAALRAAADVPGARVLISGSLYLAGQVLHANGTPQTRHFDAMHPSEKFGNIADLARMADQVRVRVGG